MLRGSASGDVRSLAIGFSRRGATWPELHLSELEGRNFAANGELNVRYYINEFWGQKITNCLEGLGS
jgi:hypothetical protein